MTRATVRDRVTSLSCVVSETIDQTVARNVQHQLRAAGHVALLVDRRQSVTNRLFLQAELPRDFAVRLAGEDPRDQLPLAEGERNGHVVGSLDGRATRLRRSAASRARENHFESVFDLD